MSALHITKETFEKEVLQSEKTVLLDCKVDVDQEPELAAQYQVASIPTLFVIEKGEIVNHSLGAKPKAKILEML